MASGRRTLVVVSAVLVVLVVVAVTIFQLSNSRTSPSTSPDRNSNNDPNSAGRSSRPATNSNHTATHRRMMLVGSGTVAEEIERTDAAIRETGFDGEITFRPPYGKKLVALPRYLDQHDRTTVMWDVEPDSDASDTDTIVQTALDEIRPGSIILLHVMYPSRAASLEAIPGIVDGLRAEGYRFVTVSELLDMRSS
jgi:peptidoglycan/xylan/chitin deacetylase (PgdA/CDA1 family)